MMFANWFLVINEVLIVAKFSDLWPSLVTKNLNLATSGEIFLASLCLSGSDSARGIP